MDPSVSLDALEERKSYVPTGNRKTVPWCSTHCYCSDWAIVVLSFEISVNEVCGHVFCSCYSIIGIGAWILDVTRSRRTCSPTEPVNVMKTKTILPMHTATISCRYPFPVSILGETFAFTGLPAWTVSVCTVTDRVYLPCRCFIVFTQVIHLYILLSYLKGKKLANIHIITKYYGAWPRLGLLL
jgi:hypothetical protein